MITNRFRIEMCSSRFHPLSLYTIQVKLGIGGEAQRYGTGITRGKWRYLISFIRDLLPRVGAYRLSKIKFRPTCRWSSSSSRAHATQLPCFVDFLMGFRCSVTVWLGYGVW